MPFHLDLFCTRTRARQKTGLYSPERPWIFGILELRPRSLAKDKCRDTLLGPLWIQVL